MPFLRDGFNEGAHRNGHTHTKQGNVGPATLSINFYGAELFGES